jgi:hypothetical protein
MAMYGNCVKTPGIIAIKAHLLMVVPGLMEIISGSYEAALGTIILKIVVQPNVAGCQQILGTTVLVFVLFVPRTYSSLLFLCRAS